MHKKSKSKSEKLLCLGCGYANDDGAAECAAARRERRASNTEVLRGKDEVEGLVALHQKSLTRLWPGFVLAHKAGLTSLISHLNFRLSSLLVWPDKIIYAPVSVL